MKVKATSFPTETVLPASTATEVPAARYPTTTTSITRITDPAHLVTTVLRGSSTQLIARQARGATKQLVSQRMTVRLALAVTTAKLEVLNLHLKHFTCSFKIKYIWYVVHFFLFGVVYQV